MKNKYEEDLTIKKWIAILVVVLVLVFIFFMLLMGHGKLIDNATPNSINDNLTLIISFIGVIATFIVVGNFSQVSTMRDDVRDTKNSMRQENADFKKDILSQIEELQRIPEEIKSLKNKSDLIERIYEISKQNSNDIVAIKEKRDYTSQLLELIIRIASDKDLVDLIKQFNPLKDTYPIHIAGEEPGIMHTAIAQFKNDNIVFVNADTQMELNNIDQVSTCQYSAQYGRYIALINEIRKNTIDNNPYFSKDQAEDISPDIEGLDNENGAQNNDNNDME